MASNYSSVQRNYTPAQAYTPPKSVPLTSTGGRLGYQTPIGPSSPGYQQGTANTFRTPGSVLGASTGGGGQTQQPQGNPQSDPGYDQLQQQQDAINQQLESDYNQAMSSLDFQQQGLQGQAGTANALITNDAAAVQTSLGAQQATGEQGVAANLSTAETSGKNAMQQARDVFRQTQQQNNAQLSALGISSSSVAEALAERLGVDVAKRIAGVTGSLDEVRQNATQELGRIKNYYAEKKTQLDENVRIGKETIQQSLMQGLQQINAARNQAASDKAAKRANLLSQVSSSIAALTQQQQQFDQQLQQWAAQKSASLTPIAQDPNYLNTLMETANTFNKQYGSQGLVFAPQVEYDKYGTARGSITSSARKNVDQYGNPIDENAAQDPFAVN